MAIPKTQNWKAWQDLQPVGNPRLIVVGQIETTNTNHTPHLKEHVPQGINPKILMLDLSIATSGVGNTVMTWRDVRFEKAIEKDQYSSVDILWEGDSVVNVDVQTVQ